MNVNAKVITLESETGYPVRPDVYSGDSDKYITFTYEDERGELFADDQELETTAYLQISLYTPENFNYFADKAKIKAKLKSEGFNVETIKSWLEDSLDGTHKTRHTVFIVNITETEAQD